MIGFNPWRSATSFTVAPGRKLSDTIRALTSSGQWRCASRRLRRVVRTSSVVSMEKLLVARPWKLDHRSGDSRQCGAKTPVTVKPPSLQTFSPQKPLQHTTSGKRIVEMQFVDTR